MPHEERALVRASGVTGSSAWSSNPAFTELWRQYKSSGDEGARERLVVRYAPLVKYVAHRLRCGLPTNVEEADLVSYGLSGLISAIERFDPSRGIKFETYAITRIRGEIIDELRKLDWVPRSARARARDIELANAKLEVRLKRAATDEEVAAELQITVEEFHDSLIQISHFSIVALDELWNLSDSGSDHPSLLDTLPDRGASDPQTLIDRGQMRAQIAEAIAVLPEREKLVIALCYYENLTLREIGEVLGVTESRVSQLHTKSVLRLRSKFSPELETAIERVSSVGESARLRQSYEGTVDKFCHVLVAEQPYRHTLCGKRCPLPVNHSHEIGECPKGFPVCPKCARIGGADRG